MEVQTTKLPGLLRLVPVLHRDARGHLCEVFQACRLAEEGIDCTFVQDNWSRSVRGVVRGLHYQRPPSAQAKLINCVRGAIWDVAVDLRSQSPTFGKWEAFELSEENSHQLFIPVGFAHGFAVLSDLADVIYKCSAYHDPATEAGVHWAEPELALPWPVRDPIVSPRDQQNPSLASYRRAPAW
ncbi:MAG TPA: dTDP-4-dehydrorhamnose 3,5-epimerase [Phycisphaerae bacterium]|nr:dTDP-4-dehydrorhamnose 3,5-epimerase [Phycisphaerae bacterium]HNU44694.1 dTDP-4-dehydrorhamnose 3,5-epimerase [Phycisphaerae bacterium]